MSPSEIFIKVIVNYVNNVKSLVLKAIRKGGK